MGESADPTRGDRLTKVEVSREQIRDFRLTVHHLASRRAESLAAAAAVCGIQDTPPGAAQIALGVRMVDSDPDEILRAIFDRRELVTVWGRRGSPHLVPSDDLSVFTRGLLPDDEQSWRSAIAGFANFLKELEMSAEDVVAAVRSAANDALEGTELTKRELGDAIRPRLPRPSSRGSTPAPSPDSAR